MLLAHSSDTHQKIIDAYHQHGSVRKTAAALNLAKSTVHDHLKRAGIETTQSGPPVEDMPGRIIPSSGEDEQSDTMARKLQQQSQSDEENDEPLPKGTPPIPGDISPKDLESLQDPQEQTSPSHRFQLEAVYRYINCLANGVHPTYAENAAKSIDPDFWVSPEETERWQTALEAAGYNPRAMPLSEQKPVVWLFSSPDPPQYVSSVYDQFAMDPDDTSSLADLIEGIRQDAYLSGINQQLTTLNLDHINQITDADTLATIRSDAENSAAQIASTYNSDLASQVGSSWLDAAASQATATGTRVGALTQGALTADQREAAITSDTSQWADARAGWKAQSIATTEASDAYSNGVMDFATQNGGATMRCVPDDCVCDGCQDLCDLGDMDMDDAKGIDLPLHPGCVVSGTLVAPLGKIVAMSRAAYHGPVVIVRTVGGREFTATANHPVLTQRGWVAAETLRQGDDVLSIPDGDLGSASRLGWAETAKANPVDATSAVVLERAGVKLNQRPTRIEDLFDSLSAQGESRRIIGTAADFHGDGRFMQQEIEVIRPKGTLLRERHVQFRERARQRHLMHAQSPPSYSRHSLDRGRSFAALSAGLLATRRGSMSSFDMGGVASVLLDYPATPQVGSNRLGVSAVLTRDLGNAGPGAIGRDHLWQAFRSARLASGDRATLDLNPASPHSILQQFGIASEAFGNGADGEFRLLVEGDHVIEVRRIDEWSGHVYDLQTTWGAYTANDTLVSNCDHSLEVTYNPMDVPGSADMWLPTEAA